MSDKQKPDSGNEPPDQEELAHRQALQYGKDLARIYVAEKAKREKLEVANQTLSAIFASVPDGLVVLDNAFSIQEANVAFCRMVEWGSDPQALTGHPIDSILLSDQLIPALQDLAADENAPSQIEFIVNRPQKRSLVANIARLHAGNLRGWVVTLHDQGRLKRLEHQKYEFINIAAHELRTPLGIVMGYVELLADKAEQNFSFESVHGLVEGIARGANHLNSIVTEIINFAQLSQAGLQSHDLSNFLLADLIKDILTDLTALAEEKQVTFKVSIPESIPRLYTDPANLRSALYQLILNGVTFNKPGGYVRIEATQENDHLLIRIIDTGKGIPQTDLELIFQPFFQVEEHATRRTGGLGLGLPIAQRAISQLGGTVSVGSTLGVGTTFTLQLPISEAPAEADALRTELDMLHQQSLAYAHDLQVLYRQLQQTNKQLQDVNIQLEEANRLKSNFLGIVSHELRSPLVPIDLALQAFPRYGTANLMPEQRELLEQLNHSFQSTRQMIDGLVEYASLLSKQGRLNLDTVNMSDLINETAAVFVPIASRRSLDLTVQVPDDLVLPTGDRERINDAVWHLLHNAIKFTAAGGKVSLRAFSDDDRIVVEVQDTGIGLSPEEQSKIWEPLTQLADALKRGVSGLGLGLALVHYVAIAHGGDVVLQSEPGKGSVFGFWLPIRAVPG